MQRERSIPRGLEAQLLFAIVIWAVNYPLAKYGVLGLDPFVFNAIRYIVAAAVLVAPYVAGNSSWTPVLPEDRNKLFWAGFIANVIYQIFFIIGLSLTTAGNSSVLLSTSPLWTIVIYTRLHREPIPVTMWLGMILSLLGVVLIIVGSGKKLAFGGHELLGDLIMITAAILWGLNNNLQKPVLVRYSPLQLSVILITIGAVGLTVLSIPAAVTLQWSDVHWTYYAAAVLSGAFSIGIGNAIWSKGVQRIGPGPTAIYNNLVPVLALVMSYFMLHENLLLIQFIGAGITILGVWIARR